MIYIERRLKMKKYKMLIPLVVLASAFSCLGAFCSISHAEESSGESDRNSSTTNRMPLLFTELICFISDTD